MPRAGRRKGGQGKRGKHPRDDFKYNSNPFVERTNGLEAWQDYSESHDDLAHNSHFFNTLKITEVNNSTQALISSQADSKPLLSRSKGKVSARMQQTNLKKHVLLSSPTSLSVTGETVHDKGGGSSSRRRLSSVSLDSSDEVILFQGRAHPNSKTNVLADAPRKRRSAGSRYKDSAALDDYIANMQEFQDDESRKASPLLQNNKIEASHVGKADLTSVQGKMQAKTKDEDGWGSAELEDFDDISTASEPLEFTPRILRKRARASAYQYLVVAEDEVADQARWLSEGQLLGPGAAQAILAFEASLKATRDMWEDTEDSPDDEELKDHDESSDEDFDWSQDDEHLDQTDNIRLTDEQIAHLFNKQQELGISGDELVLFNGNGFAPESSAEDQNRPLPKVASLHRPNVSKKRRQKAHLELSSDQDDVLDQEEYADFDMMDRSRLSLGQKNKKGFQWESMYPLSDPELIESISAAWENDRKKKRVRRQEREELRAQGLLGRNGKPDLKAKYGKGMTIEEIKVEIRRFLISSSEEALALPPIPPNKRKLVHEMASRLGMKSKSQGSHTSRFPILYKTGRTRRASTAALAMLDGMFVSKRSLQKPQRGGPPGRPTRGGGMKSAASYRDGEVVGVGAPEIGSENRGRAMLEKMGWSNGTALGALNNKGITQPVAQIVKTSRTGLG